MSINQQAEDGTTVGTVNRWNGTFTPFPSVPGTYQFSNSSTQTLQADQTIHSGEKCNHWSGGNVDASDITNHRGFSITQSTGSLVSHFAPTYSGVTILDYLVDSGGTPSNTEVSFSDPWLIDQADNNHGGVKRNEGMPASFMPRTSPFHPDYTTSYNGNVYEGVFLNQQVVTGGPYYSVGLPSGQSISVGGTNHNLEFLNWSASGADIQNSTANQTGVEFTSSNATVTANVKGNLLSSVSSATGTGSQSKIVRDDNGNLDMVYASGGEIWYTKSTDDGKTWSPEIRISAGDGYARNPSISQWYYDGTGHQNPSELCVVWVDAYSQTSGSDWTVFCRLLDVGTGSWQAIDPVDGATGYGYANSNSKPVASLIMNPESAIWTTIAFEGYTGGIVIMTRDPYYNWYTKTLSIGNMSYENPDLFTSDGSISGLVMYLTYDDGYNIYMQYATNPTPSGSTPSFGSPYEVNSGIEVSDNTSAGITVDGSGIVRFVWRGFDPLYWYQYAVWERSLSWAGWEWSSPVEIATSSSFDNPCICGHINSDYGATIMFHDETSTNPVYEVVSNNGGSSWSGGSGNPGLQLASNASFPNLPSTSDPSDIPFVVTTTNTTPYALEPGARNDAAGTGGLYKRSAPADSLTFSQIVQVVDSARGIAAAFDLSDIRVMQAGGSSTNAKLFQAHTDSSPAGVIRISPYLSTLLSSDGDNLTFNGSVAVKRVEGSASVSLALADSASSVAFRDLVDRSVTDSLKRSADFSISVGIPLAILERNPKLEVLVNGEPDTTARLTLVNAYFLNDSSAAVGAGKIAASMPVPTDYDLSQNYPNPFNPSTQIRFGLSKAAHVTLVVYDILGRVVARLADQQMNAGYHSVTWNGSNVSSGVYIYRLTAGNFVQTRRMLLMK